MITSTYVSCEKHHRAGFSFRLFVKALGILSDTTVRRSTFDREDLKPHWNSEKGDQQSHYLQLFQTLQTTEQRLTWQ